MGQAGNAIAGQIGNMGASAFGGAQQPIKQDTSSMGGNVDTGMGYTPGMQQPGYDPRLAAMFGGPNGQQDPNMFGGMPPDYANSFPAPSGFGAAAAQRMDPRMMGGEGFTPGFGQPPQQLGGQPNPYLAQVEQQQMAQMAQDGAMRGAQQLQQQSPAGLAALLGGRSTAQPAQTSPPTPTAQPTPTAKPAPVAAKPSVVPPRTPPGVASAIQKLAAKKPLFGRR
jgi:hypothetical protein